MHLSYLSSPNECLSFVCWLLFCPLTLYVVKDDFEFLSQPPSSHFPILIWQVCVNILNFK